MFALLLLAGVLQAPDRAWAQQCDSSNTIKADVVALDQPIFYNRLGAFDPAGMIYALRRDVVSKDGSGILEPGNVKLREGRRPRPLVLRVNEGQCLAIRFQNLLAKQKVDEEQPATRTASIHVVGMQLVHSITDAGVNVGRNGSTGNGLVAPGDAITYTYYAQKEGGHLFHSAAAMTGGDGDGGSISRGLFGAVNVEPPGAEYYRSQILREDLELAKVDETPDGQPILDYDAVYPTGHRFEGLPILKVTQGNEIVHGELNAIITGPDRRFFGNNASNAKECADQGPFPQDRILRNRCESFREFTVIFHDEIGILQAFEVFEDPVLSHTLHSGRDAFAINYGTGGIGAEVLGNRMGVGPMWDCNECKYEEFFLSSWTVGDPATPVDIPANADLNGDGEPDRGPKATKVLYPRDPSNVHHSYVNDHVKMRNMHAGPKEHHIFHLHAHQWVTSPDDDESTYLDSQAIGPGSTYTYEMTYDGSGNRPKTPGDAIFHCHFYPHFAQGMWELWRNHDVVEVGTKLDDHGRPVDGARTLPDGEIAAGIPIPAVVPIPQKAMPPMPTDAFPGYPFYIPGIAGHRAPHPPLDTIFDGGLPRHVVADGKADFPQLNRIDFSKENVTLEAKKLPEKGTHLERNAMNFHAAKDPATGNPTGLLAAHPSFEQPVNAGLADKAEYRVNGLDPAPGAPYADPCVDDVGNPLGEKLVYKSAAIQVDAVHNKAGWHFPQTRMFSLWDDVSKVRNRTRPPEPLFFRANTNHCVEYQLVDLVPKTYGVDDFQVVTPTDVIGQHIHLVKFDVTSSDGAANGFNYEDGSFAFDEVQERVEAIRRTNNCTDDDTRNGTFECPEVEQHPFFKDHTGFGAQTTVQRWFADDVLNNDGQDRTLRTVFTHDHFSPSTHQQTGLYAGLVTEPEGSKWLHNETGDPLGGRFDGGPTSWQAIIIPPDRPPYREFNLQVADFTLAYQADNEGVPDPDKAINPPGQFEIGLPDLLAPPVDGNCPGGVPAPCPELVSADDPGAMAINYRNEPLALRVRDPGTNSQAAGKAGDLGLAFKSDVKRADGRMNKQPDVYPPLTHDVSGGDPFTPLLRAYEQDQVQYRILVGAHEEGHNFSVSGAKWLFEPSWDNSGWRSNQMMGISEHFEFNIPRLVKPGISAKGDYLYRGSASMQGLWTGVWGLMRVYAGERQDLATLPDNPDGEVRDLANKGDFNGVCPKSAPKRDFHVTAKLARDLLDEKTLVYNSRTNQGGRIHDPNAALYVRTSDIADDGTLKDGVPVEPLILRANAGDCIRVVLSNELPDSKAGMPDADGWSTLPMIVDRFNRNDIIPSSLAGLHPQMVAVDITRSDGMNVGQNATLQTAKPGTKVKYRWYAGHISVEENDAGDLIAVATPHEFGATNLTAADPIEQPGKALIGALIIEPEGAKWSTDDGSSFAWDSGNDAGSRSIATVKKPDGSTFRELVLVTQNSVNFRRGGLGSDFECDSFDCDDDSTWDSSGSVNWSPTLGKPVPQLAESEDPEDSGNVAFNYATEPLWKRMGYEPDTPLTTTRDFDFTKVLTNAQIGGEDPQTPILAAEVGQDVRVRVVQPGGHQRNSAIEFHGHAFQQLPYVNASTELGDNPLSEWKGVREGLGPLNHFDYIFAKGRGGPAGGMFGVTGDYLYRDMQSFHFDGGLWGIFRVLPPLCDSSTDC